ncbi:MAG: hypothetical protein IPG76_22675 [Acidobacteria bacterium]|nr:hypothetical protein [Acidobacteriota bacterium]MBK9708822.1 hypothetical protein [Acidobacteriota bacterium]
MKRTQITIVAFTILLAVASFSVAAQPNRPNIIFILADDYGVGEVSAYGADNYKTPNLDALAKGGTPKT